MQLKEIRQEGDCFYCGDCLIGVIHKERSATWLLDGMKICGSRSYILTLDEFKQEWERTWKYEFILEHDNGCIAPNEKYGFHKSMATYTEEEENSYYVFGRYIVKGFYNLSLNSSHKKYDIIEIEPWNTSRDKSWYLFRESYDKWSILQRAKKMRELIRGGDYYYMFNHEKIYKVCGTIEKYGHQDRVQEHWYIMPQHYYPTFHDKILVKTMKEKCDELDNIYALMDSFNDDSNALGKILLNAYYKQHKGGK